MREPSAIRVVGGLCLTLVAISTPGCSYSYEYEIRGVILSAVDGAPLAGVGVTLKLQPRIKPTRWVGAHERIVGPTSSAPDGAFSFNTEIDDVEFDLLPRWVLILTKTGYDDAVVDIGPHGEPKSGSSPYLIAVVAYMRPSAGLHPPAWGMDGRRRDNFQNLRYVLWLRLIV